LSGTLGLLAAALTLAVLAGWPLPYVPDDRAALYGLATLGLGMCVLRMGKTYSRLGWRHPVNLLGAGLGAGLVLLVVGQSAGLALPLDPRTAFVLAAAALFGKWGLGVAGRRL
jgi:hypothetical protein